MHVNNATSILNTTILSPARCTIPSLPSNTPTLCSNNPSVCFTNPTVHKKTQNLSRINQSQSPAKLFSPPF